MFDHMLLKESPLVPQIPALINKNSDIIEERIFYLFYYISPKPFEILYSLWNKSGDIYSDINDAHNDEKVWNIFINSIIPNINPNQENSDNLINKFVNFLNYFTPSFFLYTNQSSLDTALEEAFQSSKQAIFVIAKDLNGPVSDKYRKIWEVTLDDNDHTKYSCFTILKHIQSLI